MAKYSSGLEDKIELLPSAITILEKRYLKKDDRGEVVETAEDMFRRVAYNIAKADENYGANGDEIDRLGKRFYEMMSNLYFLPNSPTLMNAGKELQQLSACFVLPIPDDLRGIYKTITDAAIVHQSGGGTGFNFSSLRPNGALISSTK